MKLKALIYSISVGVLAAVATAQESLPPEVAAARTRYETDREAAIKPVRQRYVSQLESLKKSAMVRNDLKTATAIDAEIKRIDPQAAAYAGADLRQQLKGSVWQWSAKQTLRFDGDTATNGWTADVRYSGNKATLTLRPSGKEAVFEFDADLKTATGHGFEGGASTITRVK